MRRSTTAAPGSPTAVSAIWANWVLLPKKGMSLKSYVKTLDGTTFMKEFTQGSFSEEMQQVGDVSKPVVTSYGVHILYYLKDIPEGAKELTEEFAQVLKDNLRRARLAEIISERLRAFPITYTDAYFDVIGDELLP